MGRVEGKVALVTGAARGMGASHAVTLAREGADLVIFDCPGELPTVPYGLGTREELDQVAAEVEKLGRRAVVVEGDVRSQADLDRAVETAISEFGRLDQLVANAGIWTLAPSWEMSDDQWQETIDVNLTGTWHSVKAVFPHMRERETGSIVLISSINGIEGLPGAINYCAAKFGVLGVMKTTAMEGGPFNIRCNAILPGFISTPIHKWQGAYDFLAGKPGGTDADRLAAAPYYGVLKGRGPLDPVNVSNAVLYLLSDEAKDVTGIELPIDAGHTALPHFNPAPVQ
ncbi:mycofactocin-coupled SDR family oxidoreductase [Saccharomonospora sp. NPDC046836]|uniref:mycofactocin-coupled SDR family oxidoreductase n=1 Tax=Saccharomonospora sp. NPDC046836 TaxID=3156921 RepID=UPI0034119A01